MERTNRLEVAYRNAIRVLQPSRAEMAKRHAHAKAIDAQAIAYLKSLNLTQAQCVDMYMCASMVAAAKETEVGKACRVILLGYARGTSQVGGRRDPINKG